MRVWNHTYFGFVLLASLLAAIIYLSVTSARERGIAGAFHWLGELLSLRSGHRFLGVLNWILLLALLSNFTTGFFILGSAPLLTFPRLPLHAYAMENMGAARPRRRHRLHRRVVLGPDLSAPHPRQSMDAQDHVRRLRGEGLSVEAIKAVLFEPVGCLAEFRRRRIR